MKIISKKYADDEYLDEQMVANIMTYHIQDILDNIARGGRFSFRQTEKYFRKLLRALKKSEKKYSKSLR